MSRLIKMAIRDVPKGASLQGLRWNYDHLLHPKHRAEGFHLRVSEYDKKPLTNHVRAHLYHHHRMVGVLQGYLHHKPLMRDDYQPKIPNPGTLEVSLADIDNEQDEKGNLLYKGKGFGKALYEALMAHAMHHHKFEWVAGDEHSSEATRVHQALARKHGLNYQPTPNIGPQQYPDQETWSKAPSKPFDAKYAPYHYRIDGSDSVAKVENPIRRGDIVYERFPDAPPGTKGPQKFVVKLPESVFLHVKPKGEPDAVTDIRERGEFTRDPKHIQAQDMRPFKTADVGQKAWMRNNPRFGSVIINSVPPAHNPKEAVGIKWRGLEQHAAPGALTRNWPDPRKFRTADVGQRVFREPVRQAKTGERMRPESWIIRGVVGKEQIKAGQQPRVQAVRRDFADDSKAAPFQFMEGGLTRHRPQTKVGKNIGNKIPVVDGQGNRIYPGERLWEPLHIDQSVIDHANSHTAGQGALLDFIKRRGGWKIGDLDINSQTGYYSDNKHSGILRENPTTPAKMFIKIHGGGDWAGRDNFEHDFSTAQREVFYHNMAHTYFGLGDHVPATVLLDSPTGERGHHYSAMEWAHEHEPAPWVNRSSMTSFLQRHHDNHSLPKLAIMNYIMGNTDRHGGNWMVPTDLKGPLKLIDNGLIMPKKSHANIRLPDYAWRAYSHPTSTHHTPLLQREAYDDFSDEVKRWVNNLDGNTLRHLLKQHGAESYADNMVTRLNRAKVVVNAKEGDGTLGAHKANIHRKLAALFSES